MLALQVFRLLIARKGWRVKSLALKPVALADEACIAAIVDVVLIQCEWT
jgi:hypothetical protein